MMEIFGIGVGELLIIGVVALIVLGPERLPEAARTVGKGIADLRRAVEPARSAWRDLASSINETMAPVVGGTGNPWTIHPVLEKMTPEEREAYMAGGPMPARVAADLEEMERVNKEAWAARNGPSAEDVADLPDLDYPMPHAELDYRPAPPFAEPEEELSYPAPGETRTED